jgi:hypothetical protein
MVRWDTYEIDRPDQPPPRTFIEAMDRKLELKDEGYRVKIRKNTDGAYVVYKKHDELFHGTEWRRDH